MVASPKVLGWGGVGGENGMIYRVEREQGGLTKKVLDVALKSWPLLLLAVGTLPPPPEHKTGPY